MAFSAHPPLSSLVSSADEVREAFQAFVLPRVLLRERILGEAETAYSDLAGILRSPPPSGAAQTFPGAPAALVARLRSVGLNPAGLFMRDGIGRAEAERLHMPLLAVTRKALVGLAFDTDEERVKFFNEALGAYLQGLLGPVSDAELEARLVHFITKSHYASAAARWDGDSRNLGGRVTSAAVQRHIAASLTRQGIPWEYALMSDPKRSTALRSQGSFSDPDPTVSGSLVRRFVVDGRMEICFGEPDISITSLIKSLPPLLLGEIKGRTDMSNLYESWLPTIRQKLEAFQRDHPAVPRAVFQLFLTDKMLDDPARSEPGFERMLTSGLLTRTYTLAKLDRMPSERSRLDEDLAELLRQA